MTDEPQAQTKAVMQPPNSGKPVAFGYEGDDIEEIAERIAALKPHEADQLERYLKSKIG